MEHLVRFTTAEGRDAHHTADSLDEALKFVERLRNNEEVDNVRVYRLKQVPIEFKAYYKVEIRPDGEPAAEAEASPPVPSSPAEANPAEGTAPPVRSAPLNAAAPAADPEAPGDASGRRLFARG